MTRRWTVSKYYDPDNPFDEQKEVEKWIEAINSETVQKKDYQKALATELYESICSPEAVEFGDRPAEDAIYILRGVIANGQIADTGSEATGLALKFLDPACAANSTLTEAEMNDLKAIGNRASASTIAR